MYFVATGIIFPGPEGMDTSYSRISVCPQWLDHTQAEAFVQSLWCMVYLKYFWLLMLRLPSKT